MSQPLQLRVPSCPHRGCHDFVWSTDGRKWGGVGWKGGMGQRQRQRQGRERAWDCMRRRRPRSASSGSVGARGCGAGRTRCERRG
eukprot:1849669-Rhodomonas_salina.5